MDEKPAPSLKDRFGVPPFSVLDARSGEWAERKRRWLSLGIRSDLGRGGGLSYRPGLMGRSREYREESRWA